MVAQLVRAHGSYPWCRRFKSAPSHSSSPLAALAARPRWVAPARQAAPAQWVAPALQS